MNRAQALKNIQRKIIACERCPRLRKHCKEIAEKKRAAFQGETYWGKPVPSFGSVEAELVIVGLAPAAHGANRTGRMFTGDRSGDWLFRALHKFHFANQAGSLSAHDGLIVNNAYITTTVHCAPPDNKPLLEESQTCRPYLEEELRLLENAKVYIALGQIALDGVWKIVGEGKRPKFKHGTVVNLSRNRILLLSYHPSQQNTFTKRLTESMFDQVFKSARKWIDTKHLDPT